MYWPGLSLATIIINGKEVTAQKMKNGTIKLAKVYDSIDEFAKQLKNE